MAEDCIDADYLGAYSRFFTEFIARVNPYDQLPVTVSSYNVTDAEIVGEIINVTLQYLNQTQCPPSLQAHLVHQVIQEIKSMCKKQPEDCGYKAQEKTYTSLKLMQAITGKVNEICTRYLDNSRLALLPPPPSTPLPQVIAGGNRNCRRKMEDRYVVLHDLHATFGIEDESIANYYAVFDGHAGQDAAVYCATHLHQYLAESRHYPTDPERALHDAFITTDTQFIEKSKTQKVCGGTTAVCTLLLNKKLYVAWVGDSLAMLIKSNGVVQLVNPHRLNREDEVERIQRVGGVVMRSVGIMRVNGVLSVSRAIGDVLYKPYVTGEPELGWVNLDGREDFLVIATDGLTDYVRPAEIVTILYHEIQRNPNGLKRAHQILLQWAKHAGSKDNITLVVVLLSSASEIAARPLNAHPFYRMQVDDILEKMNSKDKPLFLDIDDAHNAINSNILKQTMLSQEPRDHADDGILAASNGKHENGDADYDYSDLGPETDVDAIDDVPTLPVKNLSYEFYKDNDANPDSDIKDTNLLDNVGINQTPDINVKYQPDAENNLHGDDDDDDDEDENEDEDEDEDEDDNKVIDEFSTPQVVQKVAPELIREDNFAVLHDVVRELIEEGADDEEMPMKNEDRIDDEARDVGEQGPVDYDDSPPSPQDNKPLQHALIPEADNVADSEDSEDEWNYYRVDPNKEKDTATPDDEQPQEAKNEEEIETQEVPVESNDLKIQSQDLGEEIKCEIPKEESPELIDTEISAEHKEEDHQEEKPFVEEKEKSKDMDFQLNPDAAEFVPVSPQFAGARLNLMDYPISGSPLKQVPQMDDIQVPSQSEFEEEVCQRPREVESEDKEYQNGIHLQCNDVTDFMAERQKNIGFSGNLDDSEISSTKAEFGDESSASFLTTTEFHRTGISAVDESFSSSERDYDIAKDPMAMSFTPSDFEAAFDKGVDLNAVHNLSNTDLDDKNGSIEEEDEEQGLAVQSPELHPELTTLVSPEAEQPSHTPAFPGEPADLVNLSSQQEESEATFIEHPDKPKSPFQFLNMQSESSQMEQQAATRPEHSPLTENYSAEFESDKEAVSVDNEQPLSPSSADIDETKPIDETSEDALLPGSEFQKETSSIKETGTPSSLSPEPDIMDSDVVAPTESAEPLFEPLQSTLKPDATEFTPGQYAVQTNVESSDVSQPMESRDLCQSPVAKSDACSASPVEEVDVRPSSPMEKVDIRSFSPEKILDTSEQPAIETHDVCESSPPKINDVCEPSLVEENAICELSSFKDDVCESSPFKDDVCKSPAFKDDVCKSPAFKDDVCESSAFKDDVCKSPAFKDDDVCESSAFKDDVCESPAFKDDVCESPAFKDDVCESPAFKDDVCKSPAFEDDDVCESSSSEDDDESSAFKDVLRKSSAFIDAVRESSSFKDDVCELFPLKDNFCEWSLIEKTRTYDPFAEKADDLLEPSLIDTSDVRISSPVKEDDVRPSSPVKEDDVRPSSPVKEDDIRPSSPMKEDVLSPTKEDDVRVLSPTKEVDVGVLSSTKEDDVRVLSPTKEDDVRVLSPTKEDDVRMLSPTKEDDVRVLSPTKEDDVRVLSPTKEDDIRVLSPTKEDDIRVLSPTKEDDIRVLSPTKQDDIRVLSPTKDDDAHVLSPTKEDDVRASSPVIEDNIRVSSPVKDIYQPHTVENVDVHEPAAQQLNEDVHLIEEKPVEQAPSPQPTQNNLLDFAEDQEISVKKEIEMEPTPPPSPAIVEEKLLDLDVMVCPMKKTPEPKEELPVETEIPEVKAQEIKQAKEAALCLSESMQEFTGLECQLQPKPDEAPVSSSVPEFPQETPKEEQVMETETIKPEKPLEPAVEEICKIQQEEKLEASEAKETGKTPEVVETKTSDIVATATAAAAVVVGAAAVAASTTPSKAKAKPAAKPTKATATPKAGQKSNPTSPSKTMSSATRTSTATAKKPTATTPSRPKDLDAPKKASLSSTTSSKAAAAKPAKTSSATSTTKPAAKPTAAAKPKPAATTPKPAPSDKKPTANGDVKQLSKPAAAAAKPSAVKASPATTKAPLTTKTSTTRAVTSTTTTKTRPASAATAAKPNTTTKTSSSTTTTAKTSNSTATTTTTATSSARPKSAPTAGNATKPRTAANKPIIDKQVKETANKQISMARSTATKTSRSSVGTTTTTTTKRVSSTTKTTTASSPVKKVTAVSKVTGKLSVGKTQEKGKVVQNGVSEKIEMTGIIDDVPKKDLSPVVTPNDNQLIMSSD